MTGPPPIGGAIGVGLNSIFLLAAKGFVGGAPAELFVDVAPLGAKGFAWVGPLLNGFGVALELLLDAPPELFMAAVNGFGAVDV